MAAIRILQYLDAEGRSPFAAWFDRLNAAAAARVATAVYRLEMGNLSSVKSVGEGILERRIDFGPGYRIYFGRDGETLVILLGGGDKHRQSGAIRIAQARWADYKRRKRAGTRRGTDT
jgi:putative addiction module killer protein